MPIKRTLRQSMDYLHTWSGILFSVLVFLVCFMGTLSVFDREIDRWMMPTTRIALLPDVSFDRLARPHLEQLAPTASRWSATYPTPREPTMRISWPEGTQTVTRLVDPNTGALLPDVGTKGGTGFFFPFHYSFLLKWKDIGYWLLGLTGIVMLVALISGVIIHKKIFADFFTFRPKKSTQRAMLDLHNASSILLLPFHFVMALSGLIIFVFILMKPAMAVLYGEEIGNLTKETIGQILRSPAGKSGTLASVDAMVERARAEWGQQHVRNVTIRHPGDIHAVVEVLRRPHDQMAYETSTVSFDGHTGELMGVQRLSTAMKVQKFFSGMHMLPFDHWWLRWMYFAMGIATCIMIGTGSLLWIEKRRAVHERDGRQSYRVVNAIALAGTVGVLVATLTMLVANKLLPASLPQRALIEQLVFFGAWFVTLLHPLISVLRWRHPDGHQFNLRAPWRQQALVTAALALLALILNASVTGDHLVAAVTTSQLAVAGVDMILLATALLALTAAQRIAHSHAAKKLSTVTTGATA